MVFYIHRRSEVLCVTLVLNYCVRGAARVGTITQPAGGLESRDLVRVRLSVAHVSVSELFTRETSGYQPLELYPYISFPLSSLFATILIESRYERIERSIGVDLPEDLWSSIRYITIHEV